MRTEDGDHDFSSPRVFQRRRGARGMLEDRLGLNKRSLLVVSGHHARSNADRRCGASRADRAHDVRSLLMFVGKDARRTAAIRISNEAPPVIFFVILIFFVIFAVAVGLVLNVLFLLAYPLIVDRKLSGWEAIKTSARAAMKNFGGLLGLVLLNAGLAILGVLACYVGLILILPISFASYAAAYRQVFPDTLPSYPPAPPPPPGNWAA